MGGGQVVGMHDCSSFLRVSHSFHRCHPLPSRLFYSSDLPIRLAKIGSDMMRSRGVSLRDPRRPDLELRRSRSGGGTPKDTWAARSCSDMGHGAEKRVWI